MTSFGREEEEASRGQESRRAKRSATALELCRPRCCCCICCCCWGPGLVGLPQEDSRELRPLRVCHTGPAGPAPSPPLTFIPTSPPHPHPRGRPHACPSHTVPDGGPVSGRLSSGREGGGGFLRSVGEGSLPRAASPGLVAKGSVSSVPASSGGHVRQSSLAPQQTLTLTLLICGCRQAFLNTWPIAQPRSLKPSGGEQRPRAWLVTLRQLPARNTCTIALPDKHSYPLFPKTTRRVMTQNKIPLSPLHCNGARTRHSQGLDGRKQSTSHTSQRTTGFCRAHPA